MNIIRRLQEAIDRYEIQRARRPEAILLSDDEANAVILQLQEQGNGLRLLEPRSLEGAKLMGIPVLLRDRMVELGASKQ